MSPKTHHPLIIIGSGPAGCTAAIYAARANLNPILIAGNVAGGQLTTASLIENWPGSLSIRGPALMESMLEHVKQCNVRIVYDQLTATDLKKIPLELKGEKALYSCDALIIATGASARYLGLSSEQRFLGRGVSACATCDGYFYRGKKVAVVGGGNTAIDEALYLSDLAEQVTLIHRRDQFRAEPILLGHLNTKISTHKIKLKTNTIVSEVMGDDKNGVTALSLTNVNTKETEQLPVDGLFVAIGHTPNTQIFQHQLPMQHDYLLVKKHAEYQTATEIPGVFVAGDVGDPIYRQAITSAASGCMAAIDVKKYLDYEKNHQNMGRSNR